MSKADIIRLFKPGQRVRVTNHYITRADHPCFGTQTRTVTRVNGSAIWFEPSGRVEWPKAAQIAIEPDGSAVKFFGGGIGQQPTDLFLTIAPEGA